METSEVECPECGHHTITVSLTCHTWPSGTYPSGQERWMACQGCDSALEYSCNCWLDDEDEDGHVVGAECQCMWNYTHGLNKHNPRYDKEQESRPEWLNEDLEFTDSFPIAHEGATWR